MIICVVVLHVIFHKGSREVSEMGEEAITQYIKLHYTINTIVNISNSAHDIN